MTRFEVIDGARSRELRRAVLRPHLPADAALPGDELDPAAVVHLGAIADDGSVVSTCFVYPEPCAWRPDAARPWHLRQMATAQAQRRRGLGAGVLREAVRQVLDRGGDLVWCNARVPAAPLYERAGFQRHGPVFTDARHPVPHVRMHLDLAPEPEPGATSSEG